MRAKKLMEAFGIPEKEAKELARMIRKSVDSGDAVHPARPGYWGPEEDEDVVTSDDVLERANEILGGHGVEDVNCGYCQVDRYYYGIVLLFVNMGDTYDTTLLYDTDEQRFMIGSWGGWFEEHEAKKHENEEGEEEDDAGEQRSVKDWRP